MAGAPRFKVYSDKGEYVASCKHLEDAAAVVSLYLTGATIRDGHSVELYKHGLDGDGDSFDAIAQLCVERMKLRGTW
jgi:hypothetical protein